MPSLSASKINLNVSAGALRKYEYTFNILSHCNLNPLWGFLGFVCVMDQRIYILIVWDAFVEQQTTFKTDQ